MLHWRSPFQVKLWSLISIHLKYLILLRGCNCTDAAGREFAYSKVATSQPSFGSFPVFWQTFKSGCRVVSSGWERAKVGRRVCNPKIWIQVLERGKSIFCFFSIPLRIFQRRQPGLPSMVRWPPKSCHQIPGNILNQIFAIIYSNIGGKTFGYERSGILDCQLFGLLQLSHGGGDVGRNTTERHLLGRTSVPEFVALTIPSTGR